MAKYKVTGVLFSGKRFKAIHTDSLMHAMGINLYNGTVWQRIGRHWRVLKTVRN